MAQPQLRTACAALVLITAVMAEASPGQTPRSETGRHKPQPKEETATVDLTEVRGAGGGSVWYAGLGAGFQGGGDLWHVETASAIVVPWRSTTPFTSSRFNAKLDNDFAMGVFVGRHLGDRWSLRLDLGTARIDVAAEALQGQQAAVFLYDRITTTSAVLGAEVRLVRLPSYPYANAGLLVNHLAAAREDALDQTQVGWRVGLGYLRELSPEFSLRGEIRFSRTAFSAGDFAPSTTNPAQPELIFAPNDRMQLFEASLGLQLNF